VIGTATQVNVASNAASIQQAIDFSSPSSPVTINVSAGSYDENLTIDHPVTLTGNAGTPAKATVNGAGLAHAVSAGTSTVSATQGIVSGSTVVTGVDPLVPCAQGSYSATGNEPCTPAPPGYYVDTTGATAATPCAPGYFQDQAGQQSCAAAPIGFYVATLAATAATQCPSGTTTPAAGATSASACVSLPPIGFRVTTTSLPNGALGASYSKTLAATDGSAPYKWKKVSKLPKGLKLAAKTGVISGIPMKQAGTFSVTVQVTDATGATVNATLSMTVGPGAVRITTASLPAGTVGGVYSVTLTATNGTGPYKWKKVSKLPKGLKLVPKTGVISGTPTTTGTRSVTFRAQDKYGATATKTFSITIA
jgi:hypothetical protein